MRHCFVAAILFLFVGSVAASDLASYPNGYVEAGYTHKDGLWYLGDVAYTRSKFYWTEGGGYTKTPCGYGCGYTMSYVAPQQYFSWKYTLVPIPSAYVAPKVPAYSPGWKEKIIDYARIRDDQQAYLDALAALGLKGQSFGFQQSGYSNLYGGFNNQAIGSYGVSGATQYGYSFQQLQNAYSTTDLNALYQAAARNTQSALQLGSQANTEFGQLAGQAGDNAARVAQALAKSAEIREQGLAAARALTASKAAPSTTTITTGQGVGVGTSTTTQPAAPVMPQIQDGNGNPQSNAATNGGDAVAFLRDVGMPLCGSCHGPGKANQKQFDITTYSSLPIARKAEVWERLVTDDRSKAMPKDGNSVTLAQLKLFFKN